MRLDAYLIEHPDWQEITFTEETENVYNIESKNNVRDLTGTVKSRFSKNKKKKTMAVSHYNQLKTPLDEGFIREDP